MAMSRSSIVVTLFALLFGVLAIALSFGAYSKRIKDKDVQVTLTSCTYSHSPSFALGIASALFLLIEQFLITVGLGCFCCGGNECPTRAGISPVILFVFSWFTFIAAFIELIFASILNNRDYLMNKYPGPDKFYRCKVGNDISFLLAAMWCVITVNLGVVSHTSYKRGDRHCRSRSGMLANEGNFAMVQPQMQHL